MIFKLSLLFTAPNYGWSESWYVNRSTFDQADIAALNLASVRVNLIGNGAELIAARITSPDLPGASALRNFSFGSDVSTVLNVRDTSYNAIYVRVQDEARLYRRQMMLRGIRDVWIQFQPLSNQPNDPGPVKAPLKTFNEQVKVLGCLMRVILKGPGLQVKVPIVIVTRPQGTNLFTFTTTVNHGLAVGDIIRIGKTRGLGFTTYLQGNKYSANKGQHIVTGVPDPKSFAFETPGLPDTNLSIVKLGYVVKQLYDYVPIYYLDYQRYTKRDTGRPFFLPVGKAPARR